MLHSWRQPWPICLALGVLLAIFLGLGARRALGDSAILSHRAGLYWLQRNGAGFEPVQLRQVWRSPWWLTLQLAAGGPDALRSQVTVWRFGQPPQAWRALRLCANRLPQQVRVQNKDTQ
ncbi:MAG: hypothetical protein ACN6OD_17880 [Alcaligenes sp.]